jgi:oxygen-independent coproporphyrinogen-3 oxidase
MGGILLLMNPYSVYIHIPFCRKRCSYCDFNTYAGRESLIPEYIGALVHEIMFFKKGADGVIPVHSIYFGGGTPSLLPPDAVDRVLTALDTTFSLAPNTEITLEANPGSISLAYLRDLFALGINRISLGMQSAIPQELLLLRRQHDYPDVIQSIRWARQARFDNLSLDLIFGLPGQSLPNWDRSLALALGLGLEHFSIYALTIEEGTTIHNWASRGLISSPDPDLAADMYESATDRFEKAGYRQYEISNWAWNNDMQLLSDGGLRGSSFDAFPNELPSMSTSPNSEFACLHNLQYWRNLPYLGLGAGAHGYVNGVRTVNVSSPNEYIQRLSSGYAGSRYIFPNTPATLEMNLIDRETEMRETMMMGLRLTHEGVSKRCFEARFGIALDLRFGTEINQLIQWGLLEWVGDILRLTPRGRLLGNQVFMRFV